MAKKNLKIAESDFCVNIFWNQSFFAKILEKKYIKKWEKIEKIIRKKFKNYQKKIQKKLSEKIKWLEKNIYQFYE